MYFLFITLIFAFNSYFQNRTHNMLESSNNQEKCSNGGDRIFSHVWMQCWCANLESSKDGTHTLRPHTYRWRP